MHVLIVFREKVKVCDESRFWQFGCMLWFSICSSIKILTLEVRALKSRRGSRQVQFQNCESKGVIQHKFEFESLEKEKLSGVL